MHRQAPSRKATQGTKQTPRKQQKHSKPAQSRSIRKFGKSKINRNGFAPYDDRLMTAEEAVERFLIPTDTSRPLALGVSGFTGVSSPKAIPEALVKYVDQNDLAGKFKYDVFIGASDPTIDDCLASRRLIHRRMPFASGKTIQSAMNTQLDFHFTDQHLSSFGDRLLAGHYHGEETGFPRRGDEKQIDVGILEATEITDEGDMIGGLSVGLCAEVAAASDKIIIELNTARPSCFGLHDIAQFRPIGRKHPWLINKSEERVGDPYIRINPSRVVGIIETQRQDPGAENTPPDDVSKGIAGHLIEFLEHEIKMGRLPAKGLHLQSGVGNVANAVVDGFGGSNLKDLRVWTEVLQDSFIPLIESGKVVHASTTGIKLSQSGLEHLYDNFDFFKNRIIVRNQSLSNAPEILSRIGVVSMNTPVEVSMYGTVNSSHVGSRIISGLGGSNDMSRSAMLSVMHTPSTRPSKTDPHGISCIVPMVSHVDSTDHDLMVFVTECGIAPVRGLSPIQRAKTIIEHCAHPLYKDQLNEYLDVAIFYNKKGGLDTPHLFDSVFDMHTNHERNGTMRLPAGHFANKHGPSKM